jgi:hypothetical protein
MPWVILTFFVLFGLFLFSLGQLGNDLFGLLNLLNTHLRRSDCLVLGLSCAWDSQRAGNFGSRFGAFCGNFLDAAILELVNFVRIGKHSLSVSDADRSEVFLHLSEIVQYFSLIPLVEGRGCLVHQK